MLNYVTYGEAGSRPPLIIAHGLFGAARNWGVISKRLSDIRQVVAVDMRNHGDSPHFDQHTYPLMADDLAEVIQTFGGHADVLGHSMGGKAAMTLALRNPELVSQLFVADIAPVSYDHTQLEFIDAMQALDLSTITRRSDADAQLIASVPNKSLRAFFLQSLDLTGNVPAWRLNLEVLRKDMADIMSFPTVDQTYAGPATFITGAASDYVSETRHGDVTRQFPTAQFKSIPDTGHWLHAEKPREFEQVMRTILDTNH